MLPDTGRVYHPGPRRAAGVGLVKSSLAIEFSKLFEFGPEGDHAPPTHFTWRNTRYELTNEIIELLRLEEARKGALKEKG